MYPSLLPNFSPIENNHYSIVDRPFANLVNQKPFSVNQIAVWVLFAINLANNCLCFFYQMKAEMEVNTGKKLCKKWG
jgi:hypothetical protein